LTMLWRLVGPTLPARSRVELSRNYTPVAAPIATRGALLRRAQRDIDTVDRALQRTPCHWCESGLYPGIPRLCVACGRIRIERRRDERPNAPIEYNTAPGRVLSVR
jgi:hypothetical protein